MNDFVSGSLGAFIWPAADRCDAKSLSASVSWTRGKREREREHCKSPKKRAIESLSNNWQNDQKKRERKSDGERERESLGAAHSTQTWLKP